ncbi:MAG: hypothetical protein ORN49_01185, partial [Rhodobacteraceae bacterium]|nr:hypothetical protein [Paracoccaceae bacterium]
MCHRLGNLPPFFFTVLVIRGIGLYVWAAWRCGAGIGRRQKAETGRKMAQKITGLRRLKHFILNGFIRAPIELALLMPYGLRVRFMGAMMRHVIAPFTGYRRRALDNLALIWPEMPLSERRRIAAGACENAGRALIENYATRDLIARMKDVPIEGPGYEALRQAQAQGRPVILMTGHFGNYEAARAALVSRGFQIGGLYRPMVNAYFNAHYERTMQAFGGPVFAQGRQGTTGFVRHLKAGGHLVLLHDQKVTGGSWIDFLGQPAQTATSAAELA